MGHSRLALAAALIMIAAACRSYQTPRNNAPARSPTSGYSVQDPAGPAVRLVTMTDYRFVPESLEVLAGDTVKWENHGTVVHTTTSGRGGKPDGAWDATLNPRAVYARAFPTAGVYYYFCTPHVAMGMQGVIVVKAR